MNDTLKIAGRIGAELGAAKAELERLSHKLERARDHLTHARHDVEIRANAGNDAARLVLKGIDQWLSDYDQSPTDTFTAVDMATAAAQGFRDGQAAVEQAPAQDEQPAVFWVLFDATGPERFIKKDVSDGTLAFFDSEDEAHRAKRRHPGTDYKRVEYYRAPIAQTAPQPEQSGLDPHAIAQQVREALDRQACPNAWMVIAYEATVTALSATPSPAKRGDA